MKTDLQIAQELESLIMEPSQYWELTEDEEDHNIEIRQEAKSNLEGLGCGKYKYLQDLVRGGGFRLYCGKENWFCPDCLAKGVDKAKAIYEEILK